MMHMFTAGAWNPALMKAGFAAMLTDGTDDDGMTAEGSLDCERAADSVRAEMVALQGASLLLLKLADEGDHAVVHVSDPGTYERLARISDDKPLTRMFRGHDEYTDYFSDGAFLRVADPGEYDNDAIIKKSMEKVIRMAQEKAGLVPPVPDAASENDDEDSRCPVCGGAIDQDDIDVNNNTEDGYGEMKVPHMCPHCGAGLYAYYDAQDGYAFLRFETD